MSITRKIRIYKIGIRTIIAFTIETRAETTATKKFLRTT